MVKLIYGEEVYLLDKNVEAEISGIELPEMNVAYYDDEYDIASVERDCSTEPFLADKRAVVLRFTELKASDALKELIKSIPDTTILLIVAEKVDKRSGLFKALQKDAVQCVKPDIAKVVTLISKVAEKEGCKVDRDAAEEMINRLGYYAEEEVNLYSVVGMTRQLASSGDITLSLVKAMLPESAAGKVWSLLSLICDRKSEEAFALLSYLLDSGESGIGILSVLLKSFRLAWKERIGVSDNVPRFQYAAATKYNEKSLLAAQEALETGIEQIKSGVDAAIATSVSIVKLIDCLEK